MSKVSKEIPLTNILLPEYQGIPIWVIYGYSCFPSILCCKLHYLKPTNFANGTNYPGSVNIWGYSVYKRVPEFRTLGVSVQKWIDETTTKDGRPPKFFTVKEDAFEYLSTLITPKV